MKTEKNIKSDTVEGLGRSRYVAMKWLTVGYVFFLGSLIAGHLIESLGEVDRIYRIIDALISLVGGVLFSVFLFRLLIIMKRINSNSEYKQILNDEYYVSMESKTLRNAYVSFVLVSFVSISATMLYPSLPAVLVSLTTFFVVFIITQISWLVYNR